MEFSKVLENYLTKINKTASDLSKTSNLSPTVISRYKNGKRTPSPQSEQLQKIIDGLLTLYKEEKISITKEEIYNSFTESLGSLKVNKEQITIKFNIISKTLNININDFSKKCNFDSSILYKIRNGKLMPSRTKDFVEHFCTYITTKYNNDTSKEKLSIILNCEKEKLDSKEDYFNILYNYFINDESLDINSFLNSMNNFDLDEYIKAIKFDEIKVPYFPLYIPQNKSYYGLDEMKKGELDFFKATILSKSEESVLMYSSMPMEDMANDKEFGKKWMYAIAMMLKKGLKLNIIHNLNRPAKELMLGLESWIPIYMTGQVNPYYLNTTDNNIEYNLTYVSGNIALYGECIKDNHDKGKYYLTKTKKEVDFYKIKRDILLNKAEPLMKIYKEEEKENYYHLLENSNENTRRIISTLPIHTISKDLLKKILKRNKLDNKEISLIINYIEIEKNIAKKILKEKTITDEIDILDEDEFIKETPSLFLANYFLNKKITYTYKEYQEHLKQTVEYQENHKNYKIKKLKNPTFKNIQISIHEDKYVIISKILSPSIHFVIYNKILVNALKDFTPPITENPQN